MSHPSQNLGEQIEEAVSSGEVERQLEERKRRLGMSGGGES